MIEGDERLQAVSDAGAPWCLNLSLGSVREDASGPDG